MLGGVDWHAETGAVVVGDEQQVVCNDCAHTESATSCMHMPLVSTLD